PASVKLNLLPDSWRQRRTQLARRGEWRKRLTLAGAVYGGVFFFFLLFFCFTPLAIFPPFFLISRGAPPPPFLLAKAANWKSLAPAIDSRYYPVEILFHLYQNLPSADVHITAYNQSARQISVDGEANSAQLAYQFAEKIKKDGALQNFRFDMAAPRILP